jgi:hypothetical protein
MAVQAWAGWSERGRGLRLALQVLRMDPEIECYTPTHNTLMAIAGVGLVLYTVGYARSDFGSACAEHKLVQLSSDCYCGALICRQETGAH